MGVIFLCKFNKEIKYHESLCIFYDDLEISLYAVNLDESIDNSTNHHRIFVVL